MSVLVMERVVGLGLSIFKDSLEQMVKMDPTGLWARAVAEGGDPQGDRALGERLERVAAAGGPVAVAEKKEREARPAEAALRLSLSTQPLYLIR